MRWTIFQVKAGCLSACLNQALDCAFLSVCVRGRCYFCFCRCPEDDLEEILKPKLAANIEKARIAMSRLEEIFTQNPSLQTTSVMRQLLDVYKDCRLVSLDGEYHGNSKARRMRWVGHACCHLDTLSRNRCANREQYNSRCWGTALWICYFPGNNYDGRDIFYAVRSRT
jgi:hypothetical protein